MATNSKPFSHTLALVKWSKPKKPKSPFQLNGYKIKWSKIYGKWQVCKDKAVLEEFNTKEKARSFAFAKNN